jgi:hypothetical protein
MGICLNGDIHVSEYMAFAWLKKNWHNNGRLLGNKAGLFRNKAGILKIMAGYWRAKQRKWFLFFREC